MASFVLKSHFCKPIDSDVEDGIEADVRKMKRMRKVKVQHPFTDTDSDAPTPGPSDVKTGKPVVRPKRPYVRKAGKEEKEEKTSLKQKPGKLKTPTAQNQLQGEDSNTEKTPQAEKSVNLKKESDKTVTSKMEIEKATILKMELDKAAHSKKELDKVANLQKETKDKVSVKKEPAASDSEVTVKAQPRKKSMSVDSEPSGSVERRGKIDVYLSDSGKRIDKPAELTDDKKRFKTFEEAFMYSISGKLGRRNATKRSFDQFVCGRAAKIDTSGNKQREESVGSETDDNKPSTELKNVKEEKVEVEVKAEPSGDSGGNLSEDIEVLKQQTDKFLEKYKKDKPPDKSGDAGEERESENNTNVVKFVSEHSYVSKKKKAASSETARASVKVKKDKDNLKGDVPHDLVEKHKDLGTELIQLTHDIIQQQTTKSHKFLDQRNKGALTVSPDRPGFPTHVCMSSIEHSKFGKSAFGEPVSSPMIIGSPQQSHMFVKEFGSGTGAASSCLDFSQLASQAKHIETIGAEKPDMNLMFTIQKLSSALQGQTQTDSQRVLQLMPTSQAPPDPISPSAKTPEKGRKNQPTILRPVSSASKAGRSSQILPGTSPKSGLTSPTRSTSSSPKSKCPQKSPISSPTAIHPKQALCMSPQAKVSSTLMKFQSPPRLQLENPLFTPTALNWTSQSLSYPTSSVSKSPSSFVHHTVTPSFTVQQPISSLQAAVNTFQQPQIQGLINNSQLISNVQKTSPVSLAVNPTTLQTMNQVFPGGQLLTSAQPHSIVTGSQSFIGSPAMLLQPQTVQQLPGRIITQSVDTRNVQAPQTVTTGQQNMFQVQNPANLGSQGVQGTAVSQEAFQSHFVTNGNQTFLVNIPVMGPTISTNTSSGSFMATGNMVTSVSSQEKQNKVGQILAVQNGDSVNKVVTVCNGNSLGSLTPLSIITSTAGMDGSAVSTNKTIKTGRQTVCKLLLAAKNNSPNTRVVENGTCINSSSNRIHNMEQTIKYALSDDTKAYNNINSSRQLINDQFDASLPQKAASLSPPPILMSPAKTLQLIPQPIVPITQTFTSSMTTLESTSMPAQLLQEEELEDMKPPVLEMEPPMLEMEAPILRMESEHDNVSIKSDPDTLSNYSISSSSQSVISSFKHEGDNYPVYPMSSNDLETAHTIVQTSSYNSFIGNKHQNVKKRRRKSGPDGEKNVIDAKREFHSDGEESSKKVTIQTQIDLACQVVILQ